MRVVANATIGLGYPHGVEQFHGPSFRLGPGRQTMHEHRLRDLIADCEDRVERGHGLLEDQRNPGATDLPHLAFGKRQQVSPLEQHAEEAMRPGGWTSRRIE